ncbi:MAG: thioesterase superfamily protein [Deltaproteobacteria bacterium]|nr:thioesterase superfamily protein [Deltaproteobacteria bacterium]
MPIKESYEKALRKAVESAPYYQLLQIRLEEIDVGFARFRMPFRRELVQAYGVAHGGAITSLADTAVAFALMTLIQPGERVTTVEMKINFLTPVIEGELVGESRVIQKGKRLALADMEVKDQNGKLVAKGLATYMIISPGKKEQSGIQSPGR